MAKTLDNKCSASILCISLYLGTSSNFKMDQDDLDKLVNLIIGFSRKNNTTLCYIACVRSLL